LGFGQPSAKRTAHKLATCFFGELLRAELLRRIGLGDLLIPRVLAPSTKDDPVDGVMAGLEKLAANVDLSMGQLLSRTSGSGTA
jgi:hypothetical protein